MTTDDLSIVDPIRWACFWKKNYPCDDKSGSLTNLKCDACGELADTPCMLIQQKFPQDIMKFVSARADYVSPNLVCVKCAAYMCDLKFDHTGKSCIGALPLVPLSKENGKLFLDTFQKNIGDVKSQSLKMMLLLALEQVPTSKDHDKSLFNYAERIREY